MPDLAFISSVRQLDTLSAVHQLSPYSDQEIASFLCLLGPARAASILEQFPEPRRDRIAREAAASQSDAWEERKRYPEGSVGRLLDRAPAVFREETTVADCVRALRSVVKQVLVTYVFAVDGQGRLVGVVTFRDLLFAAPERKISEIMVPKPFSLKPETRLIDAMHEVVLRHFPVYPVCDGEGVLLGMVRGPELFEEHSFQISAQVGSMVGVDLEERLTTPWWRSFRMRHPWLQLNLLTAFLAGAVVSYFQQTIDAIVLLAVFLPVLAGQCSNTGTQAMAVVLRGLTLGEEKARDWITLLGKEAWLGLLNGLAVGVICAAVMYLLALGQVPDLALRLALVTLASMAISCVVSGITGAGVPLALKRLGTDPATASSIFLTTGTDVASIGIFLLLASVYLF